MVWSLSYVRVLTADNLYQLITSPVLQECERISFGFLLHLSCRGKAGNVISLLILIASAVSEIVVFDLIVGTPDLLTRRLIALEVENTSNAVLFQASDERSLNRGYAMLITHCRKKLQSQEHLCILEDIVHIPQHWTWTWLPLESSVQRP